MWWLSQAGGQSTGAENAGLRELRNLGVVMRWTPGSRRPASLDFLLSCSECGWQEQKAWGDEVHGEVRRGEFGGELRSLRMGHPGSMEPMVDGSRSQKSSLQCLCVKSIKKATHLGECSPMNCYGSVR